MSEVGELVSTLLDHPTNPQGTPTTVLDTDSSDGSNASLKEKIEQKGTHRMSSSPEGTKKKADIFLCKGLESIKMHTLQ